MSKDAFKDRESSFEAKFKLDEEQKFKVGVRHTKLMGLWAAQQMGMTPEQAEVYAAELVKYDLGEAGHDDVVRKLVEDFGRKGTGVSEQEIRAKSEQCMADALAQIVDQYPEALDKDHSGRK